MSSSKKSICQDALVRRILTLDIAPGAVLDEAALSHQYELSRTPLREVFQRLAGEGFISITANRGAKVSSMDLDRMRHFFQAAGMIYAAVARLASENASADQVDKLRAVQKRFSASLQTDAGSETALINHEFHAYIGVISGNPYLTPSYNRLLIDHTRIGQRFYAPATAQDQDRIEQACAQHEQLIDAIARHAATQAVQITLDHWELTRNQIETFVRPDPLVHDIADRPASDDRHAI